MASDKIDVINLPRWVWRVMIAASVLAAVASCYDAISSAFFNRAASSWEALGMEGNPSTAQSAGWYEIVEVGQDGAAAAAGIVPGDLVRHETFLGDYQSWQAGDEVSLTVLRGERRFPVSLIAQAPAERSVTTQNLLIANAFRWLLMTFFTLLLLIRGRGNRAATMLAIMLPGMSPFPGLGFLPDWAYAPVVLALKLPCNIALGFLWPYLALAISGGASSARQGRLVSAVALASGFVALFLPLLQILGPTSRPLAALIWIIFVILHQLFGYGVVATNYRRNDAAARNRIKIVAAAFVLFMLMVVFGVLSLGNSWLSGLLGVVALALLAYGLLRQRLFDFNFAVNRTLVYGAAAFTLLVVFGLVEYVAKSMIPVAWPTAGPFISAGLAVLLFLSFHRLHHWFEHHIERFFFKEWQEAEKALRRFVHSASHFDRMPALCGSTVEAVSAYAGGSDAALYLRASDGSYRLAAGQLGGAPDAYLDDNPAFALMRAERKPLDLAGAPGALPGAMAFPMVEQGALAGFVLLDGKKDGTHYRPDQVELLDWAVHHIGLDLRALHARQLESEVVALRERNAALAEDKDKLTALLAKPA
ncbi:MAG TPA: hypothetical protein VLA37_09175 [Sphingomonadaceae bacterium]|nr:hypothetical protein [Sphingomonadaceae bacterium]